MSVTPTLIRGDTTSQYTITGHDFFEEQYSPAAVDFIRGTDTTVAASSYALWSDTTIAVGATLPPGIWSVRVTREDLNTLIFSDTVYSGSVFITIGGAWRVV